MGLGPRPWNKWYRQFIEGNQTPLWEGVYIAVRCHRYAKEDINGEVASDAMLGFLKFVERHGVDPDELDDSRLEGTIQTIINNIFVSKFRKWIREVHYLSQLGNDEGEPESSKRGITTIEEASFHPSTQVATAEQILMDREAEGKFRSMLTDNQRFIFDNYRKFTGCGADMGVSDLTQALNISSATFFREIDRIKQVALRIHTTA